MNLVPQPQLNLTLGVTGEPKQEIVKAEQITTLNTEILGEIRDDRQEVSDIIKNFMEMVINEGDSTQASKEALVNLLKIKSEISDKKTRVMDLMLRAFQKDRSMPTNFAAMQHNEYKIDNSSKRSLLKSLEDKEKNEQSQ